MEVWIHLFFMLVIIFVASLLLTNALEHLGQKLELSAGVVGSLFAAVATALPETSIPIIAIVAGTSNKSLNEEVSVGAILGAPFMLSTLSLFIVGLFALRQRGLRGTIQPEKQGVLRDLHVFLFSFFLAAIAMFVPMEPIYWRGGIAFLLVCIYLFYIVLTINVSKQLVKDGHGVVTEDKLFFSHIALKEGMTTIVLQLIFATLLLFFGAKGFIADVETISNRLAISALLLSLIIIPIATELPEKVNSILWVRQRKDTLGVANITGAMVFQGSLLPALGILLTPWMPTKAVLVGVVVTLIANLWLHLQLKEKGIPIVALALNGMLYVIYLCVMLW